jgi:hypothetical protein
MAHSQLKSVHNDACIYYVLVKWLVYAWPSKTAVMILSQFKPIHTNIISHNVASVSAPGVWKWDILNARQGTMRVIGFARDVAGVCTRCPGRLEMASSQY